MTVTLYYHVKTRFVGNVSVSGYLYAQLIKISIMFFTYCFITNVFYSYVRASITVYYLLSKYKVLGDNVIKGRKKKLVKHAWNIRMM